MKKNEKNTHWIGVLKSETSKFQKVELSLNITHSTIKGALKVEDVLYILRGRIEADKIIFNYFEEKKQVGLAILLHGNEVLIGSFLFFLPNEIVVAKGEFEPYSEENLLNVELFTASKNKPKRKYHNLCEALEW